MKRILLTTLGIFSFLCTFGQTLNEEYGHPIIILIETNPWLMIIGSDVPTFALYENGQIIYKKTNNGKDQYYEIKYDFEKTQAIIKTLGITDDLMNQPEDINASNWTDQPTNIMMFAFDSLKYISVYGDLRSPESDARIKTPKSFLTVYDSILNFNDANAEKWLPEKIEILATPYDYSPKVPLKWNNEWGNIDSPSTVVRHEDLYSIYIDKKYFKDFISLTKKLKEKQAVEINNKKYSLSYRLPFPNLE